MASYGMFRGVGFVQTPPYIVCGGDLNALCHFLHLKQLVRTTLVKKRDAGLEHVTFRHGLEA